MAKKVIQVPMDLELLQKLDDLSKSQGKARAELIRHACSLFLKDMETQQMDKLYQEGYMKMPENSEIGDAQAVIATEIMPRESK